MIQVKDIVTSRVSECDEILSTNVNMLSDALNQLQMFQPQTLTPNSQVFKEQRIFANNVSSNGHEARKCSITSQVTSTEDKRKTHSDFI